MTPLTFSIFNATCNLLESLELAGKINEFCFPQSEFSLLRLIFIELVQTANRIIHHHVFYSYLSNHQDTSMVGNTCLSSRCLMISLTILTCYTAWRVCVRSPVIILPPGQMLTGLAQQAEYGVSPSPAPTPVTDWPPFSKGPTMKPLASASSFKPTLHGPIFVASLPKSGTTSMHSFFQCGNLTALHYEGQKMYLGACISKNIRHGRKPFDRCGPYRVWSDPNYIRKNHCYHAAVLDLEKLLQHMLPI